MHSKLSRFVTTTLLGAACLTACGDDEVKGADLSRVTFPARNDFPAGSSSLKTLPAGTRTYNLDSALETSHLYVQIFAGGSLGDNHIVRATNWSGTAQFDPSNLEGCAVSVTVQVEGLDPERDEMRELAGFKKVDESSRNTIREHLRTPEQLDFEKHKTIQFTSKSCTLSAERGEGGHPKVDVKGDLTVRGATQEVMLPLEVSVDDKSLAGRGIMVARHADFGFEPYSTLGGLAQNKQDIYFVLDVRGQRAP
ncbi:YceI family protein [Archangium primigenium]|uniref:YceI family protein n=1 Tax=[Archangium] primigenium TaxID=2792470 RepID=UPI0019564974|nr:YceI family protein [Archangium primigenium]MBM7117374.1 YceI family protein [Archangium primigenium]